MSYTLDTINKAIAAGEVLPAIEMEAAFDIILGGHASEAQMESFMLGLKTRGETPSDITAGASALRRRALTITAPDGAMDIVGTGGDGIGTWNISTAAAFVLAGAGIPVAKHGNKAVSSKSGAADVLATLGVNLDADIATVERALHEAGICFLMAPRHHSAMRHVAPVRAKLKTRTIFNLLGPLSNPALVKRIMVGVFDRTWLVAFAEALQSLGATHAIVVHGDGLDEVTTTGTSHAALLRDDAIRTIEITPESAGVDTATRAALIGGDPDTNARALLAVLDGDDAAEFEAYRDIVILNAAAAMFGAGHAADIGEGAGRARSAITSGRARAALDALIKITNGK